MWHQLGLGNLLSRWLLPPTCQPSWCPLTFLSTSHLTFLGFSTWLGYLPAGWSSEWLSGCPLYMVLVSNGEFSKIETSKRFRKNHESFLWLIPGSHAVSLLYWMSFKDSPDSERAGYTGVWLRWGMILWGWEGVFEEKLPLCTLYTWGRALRMIWRFWEGSSGKNNNGQLLIHT